MAGSDASTREDRLKAALKANMARRKAQKRDRAAGDAEATDPPGLPDIERKDDENG